MEFLFKKLEVYKRSLDLVEAVDALIESVKGVGITRYRAACSATEQASTSWLRGRPKQRRRTSWRNSPGSFGVRLKLLALLRRSWLRTERRHVGSTHLWPDRWCSSSKCCADGAHNSKAAKKSLDSLNCRSPRE